MRSRPGRPARRASPHVAFVRGDEYPLPDNRMCVVGGIVERHPVPLRQGRAPIRAIGAIGGRSPDRTARALRARVRRALAAVARGCCRLRTTTGTAPRRGRGRRRLSRATQTPVRDSAHPRRNGAVGAALRVSGSTRSTSGSPCSRSLNRRGASPARSTPTRRPRLGVGAEPPLAVRRTDACICIAGISRHVVQALPAVAADISLDVAGAGVAGRSAPGIPAGGLKAFATAPVPGLNEFAAPEPAPRGLRRRLLVHVRPRVPAERQCPSLSYQPSVDVPPAVPAYGDDASVTIPFFASDRAAVDSAGQRLGCPATAGPAATPVEAGLSALRRIDAPETDALVTDFNRVAVEHARNPRQIRLKRLRTFGSRPARARCLPWTPPRARTIGRSRPTRSDSSTRPARARFAPQPDSPRASNSELKFARDFSIPSRT